MALALVLGGALGTGCGGDDDGDLATFCARAEAAGVEDRFTGLDPTDVDAALPAFRAALDAERELADVAPPAARRDVEVLVDYLDDLVAGLEDAADQGAGGDVRPDVYDDLAPRADQVEAAGDRLELFVAASC